MSPKDVKCPHCGAKPGSPCKRPSEHTVFGGGFHAGRVKAAEKADFGQKVRTLRSTPLEHEKRTTIEVGDARTVELPDLVILYHRQGNPMKEARVIGMVMDRLHAQEVVELQRETAKRLGVSQGHVAKRLKLLTLPRAIQDRVADGEISPGVAYQLTRLPEGPRSLVARKRRITGEDVDRAVKRYLTAPLKGVILEDARMGTGTMLPPTRPCPTCGGTGKIAR